MNSRQLREISKSIFSGITPKSGGDAYTDEQNGVRFIRSGEITDDGVVAGRSEVFLKPEVHKGIMRGSQLKENDLLIAIVGATIGKVGVYNHDEPANINQAIAAVRLDARLIIPEYAVLFLMISIGQAQLDFLKRPVARANINLEEIGDILIPVLPLEKQKKIAAKVQAEQKSRKQKLAQADALLRGIDDFVLEKLEVLFKEEKDKEAFAITLNTARQRCDPDYHSPHFRFLRANLESGKYPAKSISDICNSITTGFAAGREEQAFNDEEGIPHIRPLNISPFGELSFEGTKYVPYDSVRPKDIIEKSEVLLNNTNSTEWVGKTTVFEGQQRCCSSNHITRLVPKQNMILPWFLASLLNAIRSTGYLGLLATNFVNQAGINTKTLSEVRIPVPDLKLQKDIVKEVIEAKQKAQGLREEAERDWEKAKIHFETQLLGEGHD